MKKEHLNMKYAVIGSVYIAQSCPCMWKDETNLWVKWSPSSFIYFPYKRHNHSKLLNYPCLYARKNICTNFSQCSHATQTSVDTVY